MSERTVITVQHDEPDPIPQHNKKSYHHLERIKKKGRAKKKDPRNFASVRIPWSELNRSELIELASKSVPPGSSLDTQMFRVLSHGLRRSDLIELTIGGTDPDQFEPNPVHRMREVIQQFFYNNWKYINSQVRCNTCCWECLDAQVLECTLENRGNLKRW